MRFALTLSCLIAVSATAVVAQDTDQLQMAARSAEAWGLPDDPEYLLAMQRFGECSARDRGDAALRYLPGSKRSQDSLFWMLLGSNSCEVNGRKPNAAPAFYRGVVAEYHLERDFLLPDLRPRGRLQRVFGQPRASDIDKLEAGDRMSLTLIEAGSCVAKADFGTLAVLFETSPGSQEEANAINAVVPTLVGCVPSNTRLNVHPFQLRGYLAEGAYRYGVALKEGTPDA